MKPTSMRRLAATRRPSFGAFLARELLMSRFLAKGLLAAMTRGVFHLPLGVSVARIERVGRGPSLRRKHPSPSPGDGQEIQAHIDATSRTTPP